MRWADYEQRGGARSKGWRILDGRCERCGMGSGIVGRSFQSSACSGNEISVPSMVK